jgi:hypothetical protein
MILHISNKNNIIQEIAVDQRRKSLISIENPYGESLKFGKVIESNRFIALLKLFFYDCDNKTLMDENLIFNISMRDGIFSFVQMNYALNIEICYINCKLGLHRSVALAEGLRRVFIRRGYDISVENFPENAQPNQYVLSFFNE